MDHLNLLFDQPPPQTLRALQGFLRTSPPNILLDQCLERLDTWSQDELCDVPLVLVHRALDTRRWSASRALGAIGRMGWGLCSSGDRLGLGTKLCRALGVTMLRTPGNLTFHIEVEGARFAFVPGGEVRLGIKTREVVIEERFQALHQHQFEIYQLPPKVRVYLNRYQSKREGGYGLSESRVSRLSGMFLEVQAQPVHGTWRSGAWAWTQGPEMLHAEIEGFTVRLPTHDEWEHAWRQGSEHLLAYERWTTPEETHVLGLEPSLPRTKLVEACEDRPYLLGGDHGRTLLCLGDTRGVFATLQQSPSHLIELTSDIHPTLTEEDGLRARRALVLR